MPHSAPVTFTFTFSGTLLTEPHVAALPLLVLLLFIRYLAFKTRHMKQELWVILMSSRFRLLFGFSHCLGSLTLFGSISPFKISRLIMFSWRKEKERHEVRSIPWQVLISSDRSHTYIVLYIKVQNWITLFMYSMTSLKFQI